jgi:23S rRNA (uracil1939-C5)-methyltransferase
MVDLDSVVIIDINDLGISGEGVGNIQGFTIFVEGALPLETVEAQIILLKKNYGIAKLLKIIKSSPNRIKPPCPLFDRCGGCQIMHLDYPKQLEVKGKRVKDAFQRIGKHELVHTPVTHPSIRSFAYRNKIQLPVVADHMGKLQVGLYAKGSHDVVFVDTCLIHSALGDRVYQAIVTILQQSSIKPYSERDHRGELRHLLMRTAVFSKEVLVVLVTTSDVSSEIKNIAQQIMNIPNVAGVMHHKNSRRGNVVLDKDFTNLCGVSFIEEELSGLRFKVSAASFFQVNPYQASHLYQKAIDLAELDEASQVLDAYCGIGTLSLLIAKKAQHVIGVECVHQAILDAHENAKLNGIKNVEFICNLSELAIASLSSIDVVFLNPPRKGCDSSVLFELKRLQPRIIMYISCDPATLARDAQILISYGFQLSQVETFDMFPQTMHVETVAKFSRS